MIEIQTYDWIYIHFCLLGTRKTDTNHIMGLNLHQGRGGYLETQTVTLNLSFVWCVVVCPRSVAVATMADFSAHV